VEIPRLTFIATQHQAPTPAVCVTIPTMHRVVYGIPYNAPFPCHLHVLAQSDNSVFLA
jgi:hypothetical protein